MNANRAAIVIDRAIAFTTVRIAGVILGTPTATWALAVNPAIPAIDDRYPVTLM